MEDNRTLDLHGMTWSEALNAFIEFYNNAMVPLDSDPVGRLEVIHGYGSTGEGGVLRKRLRGFLQSYGESLEVLLGEEVDRNPGHTFVTPHAVLPDLGSILCENILTYCDQPRPQSKIIGKFRRNGEPEVLRAIRALETQRRLNVKYKGALKVYEAV